MQFSGILPKVFVFLCVIGWTFSSWNPELRRLAEDYRAHHEDGFLSSLTGTCHFTESFAKEPPVRVETWNMPTTMMEKGALPILVGLQRDENSKVIQAPLIFYIPGSFVNLEDSQPKRWMAEFTSLGYHTVVFPNPWGTQFVEQIPRGKLGSIAWEATLLFKILKDVHTRLNAEKVLSGPVRLAGVSSGGFFSSAVSSMDAESHQPILSEATLISPPVHFGRTPDRLDELIENSRDPYQDMFRLKLYWKYRNLCSIDSDENVSKDELDDAAGIAVFAGFYEELINSVRAYDRVKGIDAVPRGFFNWLNPEYKQWRSSFSFERYFNEYNPESKELVQGKTGHIYYWISRAYKAGFANFRILTTTDDFLNDVSLWAGYDENPLRISLKSKYGVLDDRKAWEKISDDVLVLQNGGHYGFRGSPWFSAFIRAAFSIDPREHQDLKKFHHLYSDIQ